MPKRRDISISSTYGKVVPFSRRKQVNTLRPDFTQSRRKQTISLRNDDLGEWLQMGGADTQQPFTNWILDQDLGETYNQKHNRTEKRAVFRIEHNLSTVPNLLEFQTAIDNAFESAMTHFLKDTDPNDIFSAYIEHESLDPSIFIQPQRIRDFNKHLFLDRVFKTVQSNKGFLNSGELMFRVSISKSLTGRGRGTKAMTTHKEVDDNKRSVINIYNIDNSCGYLSVAIGLQWHEWEVHGNSQQYRWKDLLKRRTAQKKLLIEFCMKYGLDPNEPMDNEILKDLDSKIDCQIIVIQDHVQRFVGTDRPKVIYMKFDGEHYDLITSMPGYLGTNFYCKYCNRGYSQPNFHKCEDACHYCRSPSKCLLVAHRKCPDCLVTFVSDDCFNYHKSNKICKYRSYCDHCEQIYVVEKNHPHNCEEFFCKTCNDHYIIQPHYCYIKPLNLKKIEDEDKQSKVIIAYDIECCLEKNGKSFEHKPILLISKAVCDKCLENDICEVCGLKEREFYGVDCVEKFVEYLINFSKIAEKNRFAITAVAHNNSGYDGHFILRELMRRNIKDIEPIMKGNKIMKIDIGCVRIIDSLLLFQRPLADLPKMFSIEGEIKGFFPHHANTLNNQEMVCHLRDIPKEKFGRQHMKEKRAEEFDNWYQRNADNLYNLKEEMIKYCRSDVRILLESVLRFFGLFIEESKIDPLTRSFTLASIGMEYFRAKILPRDTIGITPIAGYNNYRKQSYSANAWLDLMEQQYGHPIIREHRIGNVYCDGVLNQEICVDGINYSKIAFEYFGCYFHGHDCGRNYNQEKFEKAEKRRQYLMKMGAYPVFQWECEWLANAPTVYHERYDYHKKMKEQELYCNPRKALFGGRVNNLKFEWTRAEDEEIKYVDFTSLYPFVMARKEFPGGHPIIIRKDFPDIKDVFGFVSCKVLPPRDLYVPVLPYSNGKLFFPLCRTCAEEKSSECNHSTDERALTGTFVSAELQKAVEMGYEIKEIYEVLHYPKKITELFKNYVNVWYKIKAEASGWPSYCQTQEQKNEYLKTFEEREGFSLDPNKIQQNPGLRSIAKLMLNSLFGKFGQRPDLPITKITHDYTEDWDIYNDPDIEILGEVLIEDSLLINYKNTNIENARVGNTSVAIAAFVTAYARIELYNEIQKIEESSPESVLYFDTDSIVFVHKPGNYHPFIGNFLGEMTDEIAEEFGVDSQIEEFYSLGPKTYGFRVSTSTGDKIRLKAKGFTQNIASQETFNFETLKDKAIAKVNDIPTDPSIVPQLQFRTNRQHIVSTKELLKSLEVTSDKRIIVGNRTLPYGYDYSVFEFADLMAQ